MAKTARRLSIWTLAAVMLLVALTGFTRLTAPWRIPVTNDEMLHLESFRNHYRTDDIYPIFLTRLERAELLEPAQFEQVKRLYHASPLFQRGLLVLTDLHPPLFPVTAEIVEAATHSNLIAFRFVSVLASIAGVFFMVRLGATLRDRTLGLWLAALMACAYLIQIYAGIARPYALAQSATILALWMFARDRVRDHESPWRFLLAALFTQCTNWLVWGTIGPLVMVELVRRFRAGTGIGRLFRQTWWYASLSALLLAYMAVQSMNPALSGLTESRPLWLLWCQFALASPFASLDEALGIDMFSPLSPAAILLLLAVLLGLGATIGDPGFVRRRPTAALAFASVRVGLVAALAATVITWIFGASGTRIALIYVLLPIVFAGIGLQWVLRTKRASLIGVTLLLGATFVLQLVWPEDPYRRAFWGQTDFPAVAERVADALEEGDVWCAYPRSIGDSLFRYADLPQPLLIMDGRDLGAVCEELPRSDHAVVFFVHARTVTQVGVLRRARHRWDFPNGFSVVRIPPRR